MLKHNSSMNQTLLYVDTYKQNQFIKMIYLMYTILEEIFTGVSGSPFSVKLNQVSVNDLAKVNFSEYSSCAPKLQRAN